jgi:hypothetical protein
MGPYHHYCKVIAPYPYIVCQICDTTDPNAPYDSDRVHHCPEAYTAGDRESWNRLWHDHAVEIAGGRVKVLDPPPDKAKEVADLVATTDGIIYNIEYGGKLPNGKVTMAQAVGHKPLTAAEFEQSRKEVAAATGVRANARRRCRRNTPRRCRGNFVFAVRTNATGKAEWGNVRAGSKMLALGPCSDAFRVRAPLGARQGDR